MGNYMKREKERETRAQSPPGGKPWKEGGDGRLFLSRAPLPEVSHTLTHTQAAAHIPPTSESLARKRRRRRKRPSRPSAFSSSTVVECFFFFRVEKIAPHYLVDFWARPFSIFLSSLVVSHSRGSFSSFISEKMKGEPNLEAAGYQ